MLKKELVYDNSEIYLNHDELFLYCLLVLKISNEPEYTKIYFDDIREDFRKRNYREETIQLVEKLESFEFLEVIEERNRYLVIDFTNIFDVEIMKPYFQFNVEDMKVLKEMNKNSSTRRDFYLYIQLLVRMNTDTHCKRHFHKYLAARCKISVRTLQRSLERLEEKKLIGIIHNGTKDKNNKEANTYYCIYSGHSYSDFISTKNKIDKSRKVEYAKTKQLEREFESIEDVFS